MGLLEGDELERESFEPSGGRPRNRGRRLVGLLVLVLAGAGTLAIYDTTFRTNPNADEFCRRAGEISDVARNPAASGQGSAEGANQVRITAARLVLLHEQLEPVSPRSVRDDITETIAAYRAVVRSADPAELQRAHDSAAARRLAEAVESDCEL